MKKLLFVVWLSVANIAFCVPQNIQDSYDDICWNCYDVATPAQNFLNRYAEVLREMCYKDNDAQACDMMANLYSKIGNDFDAADYWRKACKLGNKTSCSNAQ